MSFAIHGIGTANPPDSVSPSEGLAIARLLAGPEVRTSTWLGSIYTSAGVDRRYQVIGGLAMRDALDGTNHTNSPFLPTPENDGVGPTTGKRMDRYAAEAGPLALAGLACGAGGSRVDARVGFSPRHGLLHGVRGAGSRPRAHRGTGPASHR